MVGGSKSEELDFHVEDRVRDGGFLKAELEALHNEDRAKDEKNLRHHW